MIHGSLERNYTLEKLFSSSEFSYVLPKDGRTAMCYQPGKERKTHCTLMRKLFVKEELKNNTFDRKLGINTEFIWFPPNLY